MQIIDSPECSQAELSLFSSSLQTITKVSTTKRLIYGNFSNAQLTDSLGLMCGKYVRALSVDLAKKFLFCTITS